MYPYQDPTVSIDQRVEDLLSRMTPHEKIGQLKSNDGKVKVFERSGNELSITPEIMENIRNNHIGFLICVTRFDAWGGVDAEKALTPAMCARIINMLQKYNLDNSRLGIPLLHGNPATHGHMSVGSTLFPVGLGMGSTWNPKMVHDANRVIAAESRAQGSYMSDPVIIDVLSDPRWGRTEENWGEDPYLAGEMACAGVMGLQNDNRFGTTAVASLLKHFIAHGASAGGRNRAPSTVIGRDLYERYFRPWKKAVQSGALALMPSYNEIDGVQNHANRELLTGLLKNAWGYEGYVIADENAMVQMHEIQHVAESVADAQVIAMNAGVDVDIACGSEPYGEIEEAFKKGKISEERIDDAVRRVLRAKFMLGLFEHPYTPEESAACVGCPAHRSLSKEAARQSLILLKNEHSLLPIKPSVRRIAVVGPNADNLYAQIGDYAAIQKESQISTVYKGIRERARREGVETVYARGCGIWKADGEEIADACTAAETADLIVLVVGTNSWKEWRDGYEKETNCGEGFDVSDLGLTEAQKTLLRAVRSLGKPIAAVLINGRPIADAELYEACDAVLEAWYPGSEGGQAIAEALFGDYSPAGKLTVTIPKHAGQLPAYYNRKREMLGRYCDMEDQPLFPFGFGLSYTHFEYGNPVLDQTEICAGETVHISVEVKNTGRVSSDEIVQIYIADDYSSVTRPVWELCGFKRVSISAGASEIVTIPITKEAMGIVDSLGNQNIEPGSFTIGVGASSASLKLVKLYVRSAEGEQ